MGRDLARECQLTPIWHCVLDGKAIPEQEQANGCHQLSARSVTGIGSLATSAKGERGREDYAQQDSNESGKKRGKHAEKTLAVSPAVFSDARLRFLVENWHRLSEAERDSITAIVRSEGKR